MKFAIKTVAACALVACAGAAFAQQAAPAKPATPAAKAAAAKPAAAGAAKPAAAAALAGGALKGQTVKIAFIDPLSGPFANVGQNQLKSWQFVADRLSGAKNPAGVKFEVVGFDNKGSPQESLNSLKAAIDQGFHYVTQGNGSGAALAISDAVSKNNARNPGKEVVFLNYAAVDPALTNEKCDYWHFRLDADTTMKMEALTTFMKDQPKVKNVYLLNQNYSHGQQVERFARENLAKKRPDIQIVGTDLHPLAQVRDFAPYVAKIKAAGADTVITGNWGSDLTLLIKAAVEGGYTGKFFTYYTYVTGTPSALGTNGAGRVYQISYGHYNMGGRMDQWMAEFKKKYNDDLYTGSYARIFEFLGDGMAKAKSTDPVKVAFAMEGMKLKSVFGGEVEMRKTDHQLQQALYMTEWEKAGGKYPYSPENTGMTLVPVAEYPPYVSSTPTSCQMVRPSAS